MEKFDGTDFPFRIDLEGLFPIHPVSEAHVTEVPQEVLSGAAQADITGRPARHGPPKTPAFADLVTRFRISTAASEVTSGSATLQSSPEMTNALNRIRFAFWRMFEAGSRANPGEFDGLLQLVDPSRVIDLNARTVTVEDLQRARQSVTVGPAERPVLCTTRWGKRAVESALRRAGVKPEYGRLPDPISSRNELVLLFEGAPICIHDLNQTWRIENGRLADPVPPADAMFINETEDPFATNIWFMVVGENGVHGVKPASFQSHSVVVHQELTVGKRGHEIICTVSMPTGIALARQDALSLIKHAASV